MEKLTHVGRIFYALAMTVLGLQTIYYHDFPYMMLPPNHVGIPGIVMVAYIFGTFVSLAGICILAEKNPRSMALGLGSVLLLIFCFYYIPYEFMVSPNFMHFGEWENAAKELTLASGAFVIAGLYPEKNKILPIGFQRKIIPLGTVLFSITIISYGIDHFLYAVGAADYVPSWIPHPLFWVYLGGVALLASGVAIISKIKMRLAATLLGTMIFMWFVMLHVPRVVVAPLADLGDEITSAMLALAYSGIALVIAFRNNSKEIS